MGVQQGVRGQGVRGQGYCVILGIELPALKHVCSVADSKYKIDYKKVADKISSLEILQPAIIYSTHDRD